MATPIFPAQLPGVASITWNPRNQLTITDVEGGPEARRRRSRVPDADVQISWDLTRDQFEVFQSFWKTSLLNGHRWFSLLLPCSIGYANHIVRFAKHRESKSVGFEFRRVEAILYVRERKFKPDDVYITSVPYPIYAFESIESQSSISGGKPGKSSSLLDELDVTALIRASDLRTVLRSYGLSDYIESSTLLLGGTVHDSLKTGDAGLESVQSTSLVRSGSVRTALISNTIPVEGFDSSAQIRNGSLT